EEKIIVNNEEIEEVEIDAPVIKEEKREKKTFQQMTNEEKILCILNRPKYIPQINCKIQTETSCYRGVIIKYENQIIYFQPLKGIAVIQIVVNEITNIEMIW